MRTTDKVKAAVSVGAVVIAGVFLARYFGGGGVPATGPGIAEPALTPEEAKEIERVKQEQLDLIESGEGTTAGA